MKWHACFVLLGLLVVQLSLPQKAPGVTLSVEDGVAASPGDQVSLALAVDDSTGIASGAFRIVYNTDYLELQSVENTFFESFEKGDEVPGEGTMVAGARTQTGAAVSTLLTLHFYVKAPATGDLSVAIVQSTLDNASAGYTSPAQVPFLIGADPTKDPDDPAAYPALSTATAAGTLYIDRDADGLVDSEESSYGTDINDPDSDDDGLPDGYEADHDTILDPTSDDALVDHDGDGYSTLREYLAGSDPEDDQDVPQTLLADPDGDLDVDGTDLAGLSEEFGRTDCNESPPCDFDLNGDGVVDEVDLVLFLEDYGY